MTTLLARPTTPEVVAEPAVPAVRAAAIPAPDSDDVVDRWGRHSFPASDPPANW